MDAVGGIAAITQILEQAVKGTFACIEFYKKCKEAPQVAKEQEATIQTLRAILLKISQNPGLQTDEIVSLVRNCNSVLVGIQSLLEKALEGLDDSNAKKFRRRIEGATNDGKMGKLFSQLEETKSSLTLSISLVNASALQCIVAPKFPDREQSTIYEVPNRHASFFVGREALLTKLRDLFCERRANAGGLTTRVAVLTALGGQGKTQVALRLCRNLRYDGLFAILWVDASSELSVRSAYSRYAQLMQSDGHRSDDIEYNISHVIRQLSQSPRGFLLIMDNYDRPDDFGSIQHYIPDNPRGSVLVTSRHSEAIGLNTETDDDDDLRLRGLECLEAMQLLYHTSRVKPTEQTDRHCMDIVQRLACHPLTIVQSAVYIKKRDLQMSNFMSHYDRKKTEILQLVFNPSPYRRALPGVSQDTAISVFTTWELTFQQMTGDVLDHRNTSEFGASDSPTNHDQERKLLTFCAFLGMGEISEGLFAGYDNHEYLVSPPTSRLYDWLTHFGYTSDSGWDHDAFGTSLILLHEFALLDSYYEHNGRYRFCLHPLVRDWLRIRCKSQVRRSYADDALYLVGHAVQRCFNTDTGSYNATKAQHQMFMRQFRALDENSCDFGTGVQQSSPVRALQVSTASSPHELEAEHHGARNEYLSSESPNGRWAIEMLTKTKQMSVRRENHECPSLVGLVGMLQICVGYCTSAYENQLAIRFTKRILELSGLSDRIGDMNFAQYAAVTTALTLIGHIFLQTDEHALAEATVRALLALYDRLGTLSDLDKAHAFNTLGMALDSQERYEEALHAHQAARDESSKARGEDNYMFIHSKSSIANCLAQLGHHHEAEELFANTLAISRQVLGVDNGMTMVTEQRMASYLLQLGKNEEALCIQRNLAVKMAAVRGHHNPDTRTITQELLDNLVATGRRAEAKELSDRIEQIRLEN